MNPLKESILWHKNWSWSTIYIHLQLGKIMLATWTIYRSDFFFFCQRTIKTCSVCLLANNDQRRLCTAACLTHTPHPAACILCCSARSVDIFSSSSMVPPLLPRGGSSDLWPLLSSPYYKWHVVSQARSLCPSARRSVTDSFAHRSNCTRAGKRKGGGRLCETGTPGEEWGQGGGEKSQRRWQGRGVKGTM